MNRTPIKNRWAKKEFPGGIVAKYDRKTEQKSLILQHDSDPSPALKEEITWWFHQAMDLPIEYNEELYDTLWKEPELCDSST